MLKINYPWLKPEPITLLWRNLPAVPVLRKAREPLPASRPGAFLRLVDFLATQSGRARFPRLLREIDVVGQRPARAPRIVKVVR